MDLITENIVNDNSDVLKTENCLEVEVPCHLFQCLQSNKSLENFCRICLSSNEDLVSLFSAGDDHTCLADLLKSLTSVKIVPDSIMPNQICVTCETSLVQSYNFKIKCVKAECTLQSILKGQFVPADDCIGDSKKNTCNLTPNGDEIKQETNESDDIQYLDFNDLEDDEERLGVAQDLHHVTGKGVNVSSQDSKSLLQKRYRENTEADPAKINKNCQKITRHIFTCNMCFEEFKKLKNYKKHIIEKHGTDKQSHPCLECKEQFTTQHDLQLHSVIHMAGPLWTCRECPKQFKTKTLLKRHLRRHMDSKRFKCSSCDKSFSEFYALRRHSRVHTGEIVEKKHVCNICNKKYRENSLLVAHMASHDSVRPFVCATCGKTFLTVRLLNSHRKIHSEYKHYACKFCDKRFRHDSTRNTHQRTHTGERPYVCSICGKRFIQNSNLRLHMRTHTGERPYSCDDCEKMFTSGSALKTHRRRHTGEKPYSCNICDKRFARMDLTAHMRQHTGERPYACSVCPKKFVNATRLRDHCRTHTGEKPYECASCTKTFPTKSHLVKHVKKHQPKKKQDKGYFVVPHMEPVQYIITDEKEISECTDQNIAKDEILIHESKKPILQVAEDNVSVEVADKLVLQDDGEVLVVDNSQNHSGNIYLSTGVTECTGFTNDVSLVAVNGGGVNISASSAVVEGSTVKLYQLDQSLVQIHRSGGQVTISKITSKMTANF